MLNTTNTTSIDDDLVPTWARPFLSEDGTLSMEILTALVAEYKNGYNKNIAILRSTMCLLSVISSSMLIRMLTTSKQRLSTMYHRLLLGMSIGDILYSLPQSTYQVMSPSDMAYTVWNASGNQASCSAYGVFVAAGICLTLFYSCSLNLYYLFKIKYNKTDSTIRKKIEPFLHGFPIMIALISSISFLLLNNFNNSGYATCAESFKYYPPHCFGYEDGEVREGFTIPCGRGRNPNGPAIFFLVAVLVTPIIIGVSLGMLYRVVSSQEKSIARFSGGALNASNSNSRAVFHKAAAYSLSYFLTWVWPIAGCILGLAQVEMSPTGGLVFGYCLNIFNPLEGFFNLLIFIHPKVLAARRPQGSNLSWPRAFGRVIWSGLVGGNMKNDRKKTAVTLTTVGNSMTSHVPASSIALGSTVGTTIRSEFELGTNHCEPNGIKEEKVNDGTESSLFRDEVLPALNNSSGCIEEEKAEIQAPLGSDDFVENPPTCT